VEHDTPKAKIKNGPQPLTQCEAPALDWSRPDTPTATDFGDIYFSVDGGVEETRTVFLGGCGLPDGWQSETWQGKNVYTIGELGFGSGLNFLTTWQMWEQHCADNTGQNARLHFMSIEKYPFDSAQLEQALGAWPQLAEYSERLIAAWPQRVKGFHRLEFGSVTLTLIHDDVGPALDNIDAQIDAWFLDGFSPAKNPDMWSPGIMQKLAYLSTPNARLATFTVAGVVREALTKAGFTVEKKTGFGRKRHRLEARYASTSKPLIPKKPQPTPTIIGSGIGGASLARAFLRRGITPHIITRGNERAASGNAAALIKPRLDLQDRRESRFFLAAYLYALRAYSSTTDAIISRGVMQFPKTDKEAARFAKLAAQSPLPDTHLDYKDDALSLPQSLVISPKDIIAAWTSCAKITPQEVTDLDSIDEPVFAAMGHGIKPHMTTQDSELRYSRGQISWAQPNSRLMGAVSYGGYALNVEGKVLLGATHDRLDDADPYAARPVDDARNFEQFDAAMGYSLEPFKSGAAASRVSVRVTTPNTLPMILNPRQDHFILTGLGSRGFVFAPLLAEAIVSHWLGEPLPIDKKLWDEFGPR